jgi:streptogramin lyase
VCTPGAGSAATSSAGAVLGGATVRTFTEPLQLTDLSDIKPGPDGNIWFTALERTNQIGRITPSGRVTTFPISPSPYGPKSIENIAAGFDGDLWIGQAGQIQRVNTRGMVDSVRALPNHGRCLVTAVDIIAGSDGSMYFLAMSCPDLIGQITPQGELTYFPLPVQCIQSDIVVGVDGHIWFAGGCNNRKSAVGEVDSRGAFKIYPASPLGPRPLAIVPSDDGNMYYADMSFRHALIRVNPTNGQMTYVTRLGWDYGFRDFVTDETGLWYTGAVRTRAGVQVGMIRANLPDDSKTFLGAFPDGVVMTFGPHDNIWAADVNRNTIDVWVRPH